VVYDDKKNGELNMNYNEFYDLLLCELAKRSDIHTLSKRKKNKIKLYDRRIFVNTKKSEPDFKEIPQDFIKTTFDYLEVNKEVTQNYLTKTLYVKRSAFIIAAFALLNKHYAYDEIKNSIKKIN
jgi:hypothetical protein